MRTRPMIPPSHQTHLSKWKPSLTVTVHTTLAVIEFCSLLYNPVFTSCAI
jgi:hypothetical protein